MSSPSRIGAVVSIVAIAAMAVACNAITGTGKYDLVDCPSGACGDGGAGSGSGDGAAGPGADGTSQGGDAGGDASAGPALMCGAGLAPVTLTVTGSGGSVSAKSGGNLTVSAGTTDSACLTVGTVEMRTSGSVADWSGPSCKDGNSGSDRCEFSVPAQGIGVTAALR